jgi:hypothetical protein
MSEGCGQRAKGYMFLTLVIVIWVGSAEMIQIIFTSDATAFNQPLFLTYYSTSFFTIYLIPLIYTLIKIQCQPATNQEQMESKSKDITSLKREVRFVV